MGNFAELIKHLIKRQWSSGEISARPKLENLHQLVTSAFISLYTPTASGGKFFLNLRHGRRRRFADRGRDLMFGDSRSTALVISIEHKTLLTVLRKGCSKSPAEFASKAVEAMSKV